MDQQKLFEKVIGMFKPPYENEEFLNFPGARVICSPNDRAVFGFETYFPDEWLIEDYGFTKEEADEFIRLVHEKYKEETEDGSK